MVRTKHPLTKGPSGNRPTRKNIKIKVQAMVEQDLFARLLALAKAEGRSLSAFVSLTLETSVSPLSGVNTQTKETAHAES
jgi:hypothetical protein